MPLLVRTDDRLRLAGCLLAASDWPKHEQRLRAYKAHRVAEAAHRAFGPLRDHPAVTACRRLASDGEGLSTLFAHALKGDWPGDLANVVHAFADEAKLTDFYAEHAADFEQAEADARTVLSRADLQQFLNDLLGGEERAHVFAPNLLYPGRQPVAFDTAVEIVVTAPPPIAWGSSPPWRYSERPDESLAVIAEAFARQRFSAILPADRASQSEILGLAAAVLFLREAEGPDAGDQLLVMQKKTRGLRQLPAVVAGLETLLTARRAGKPLDLAQVVSTSAAP